MTDKKTEALRLALEALEYISSHYMSLPKIGCMALAAVEEALAEQETILPGGGHVPAVPVAVYGYCPECGGAGVMRERRPNGDDKCTNGHKYPSSKALAEQPAQQQKEGFASPGGGYVPAIPRPMPLDWKLVPRKATPEMLKAMDECAQEGYDERLYAGMASSVYMAAWDASPVMGTLPERPVQQQEPVAWMDGYRNIYSLEEKAAGCPEATIALVPMANHKKTSGSPINELQCVCGAVWLGEEMVHLPDKRPPASKPWVGLTQTDLVDCDEEELKQARYWENKLKEKNT